MGMDTEADTLDPHFTASRHASIVLNSLFDTLIVQADDLSFKPWLAESWELSTDQLSYTFKLRKDVKFHDGTPFNAAAVKANLDRVMDPATNSRAARAAMGPLKETTVLDDYTVKVTFTQPFAPFFDGISQNILGMISPAAIQKYGKDIGDNPVGTGPFKFKEWVKRDHITIVKNPDYNWAAPIFKHNGPAYADAITFKAISEDATRVATVETGETNIINTVPPDDWERLGKDAKFRTFQGLLTGKPYSFDFNTKKFPTNDINVRKAILYAVDKDAIIKTLFKGTYIKAFGPLAQTTFGYWSGVEQYYPHDVAKAKQILEDAGWKVGPNGIRVKDGQPLHMVWGTIIDTRPAEQIQAQIREVGIDAEVRNLPLANQVDINQKGEEANTAMLRYVTGDPDVMRVAFYSKNIGIGFNWAFFNDPTFDKIVDDAAATIDPQKRLELYAQSQKIAMDNAITLALHISPQPMVVRSELYGVRLDTRGNTPWFYDAYISK